MLCLVVVVPTVKGTWVTINGCAYIPPSTGAEQTFPNVVIVTLVVVRIFSLVLDPVRQLLLRDVVTFMVWAEIWRAPASAKQKKGKAYFRIIDFAPDRSRRLGPSNLLTAGGRVK